MKKTRKIELKKETIRLLHDEELSRAASAVALTPQGCPTWYCVPPTHWFDTCDCVQTAIGG